jgi:hypothetical protein
MKISTHGELGRDLEVRSPDGRAVVFLLGTHVEATQIPDFDFTVRLVLDADDDERLYVDRLEIAKTERGPAVTATALRRIPFEKIVEAASHKIAETADVLDDGTLEIRYPQSRRADRDEITRALRPRKPSRRVSDDELRIAARAALDAPPRGRLDAVMDALVCSKATAIRRLRDAEAAGYKTGRKGKR